MPSLGPVPQVRSRHSASVSRPSSSPSQLGLFAHYFTVSRSDDNVEIMHICTALSAAMLPCEWLYSGIPASRRLGARPSITTQQRHVVSTVAQCLICSLRFFMIIYYRMTCFVRQGRPSAHIQQPRWFGSYFRRRASHSIPVLMGRTFDQPREMS